MLIKFKLTGPMMFRGTGEFSPMARGPRAYATSLPLPTPSTVSGCIAAAMGRRPMSTANSWSEQVEQALGLGTAGFLRGPYLIVDDETYLCYQNQLINSKNLWALREIELTETLAEGKSLEELLKPIKVERIPHVGIGLKEGKVVDAERGLIYLAEFVDYEAIFRTTNIWIAVEAHNFDVENISGKMIRFGGEGKLARLDVVKGERPKLWNFMEEFLKHPSNAAYLYLLTYAFIPGIFPEIEKLVNGAYLWPGITNQVRQFIKSISDQMEIDMEYAIGRVTLLGAGYDLSRGVKKPMYVALEPGSILKIHAKNPGAIRLLYEKGVSSIGGKLGYGTFLPIAILGS